MSALSSAALLCWALVLSLLWARSTVSFQASGFCTAFHVHKKGQDCLSTGELASGFEAGIAGEARGSELHDQDPLLCPKHSTEHSDVIFGA